MVFRRQLSSGVLTPSRRRQDSVRRLTGTHWLQGSGRGSSGQRREPREQETLQGREPDTLELPGKQRPAQSMGGWAWESAA